jgi:sugar lactone lactonase YvrE
MTPSGNFSYLLERTDNPPEGISIWSDREGNTYHVTTYPGQELLVLRRSPKGEVAALVGNSKTASEYSQGVPYSIGGTAFGPDGTLYFTYGANAGKLTKSGTLTALARNVALENAKGDGADSNTRMLGIAVDAQGNAFVADYGNRRVLKITSDNQMTTLLRAEELWAPTGVALRNGELYILEYQHTKANVPIGARVRKLSTDGKVTTLATVGENSASNASTTADDSSPVKKFQADAGRNIRYAVVGAVMSIVALTLILWLVFRRKYARQHGNT